MVVYFNECQPSPAPQFVFISPGSFILYFLFFSSIDDNTQQPRGRKEAESYTQHSWFGHVARHADVTLQPPALLEAT